MNAELWEGVQQALDARRDPLADEAVRAALLEQPDDALEVCALRSALDELEGADLPLRAARRSRLVPLACAAALLCAASGAWLALRPARLSAAQELELHPVVAAPQFGSVQAWEVTSSLESAAGTRTVRASEGRVTIENEYSAADDALEGGLARAVVFATSAESWSAR